MKEFTYRRIPGMRLGGVALQIVQLRRRDCRSRTASAWTATTTRELDSLRFRLFSPAPVYPGLEEAHARRIP